MGIRVAGVSKEFGSFKAVDEVSLDVETGSLVALLGPSGSGAAARVSGGSAGAGCGNRNICGS